MGYNDSYPTYIAPLMATHEPPSLVFGIKDIVSRAGTSGCSEASTKVEFEAS